MASWRASYAQEESDSEEESSLSDNEENLVPPKTTCTSWQWATGSVNSCCIFTGQNKHNQQQKLNY